MHSVCKNLRGPLNRYVMLIGTGRRPALDCWAVWHRLRHTGWQGPLGRPAALRTALDFSTMGGHFNPDCRNIAHLTLCITHHLALQQ